MTGEIVFHLGDPKTGSTAIQETLATGAFRCATRSLVYPARLHHHLLARSFYVSSEIEARPRRMRRLAEAVERSDADTAVVSAELFQWVDPVDLKQAIETWLPGYTERVRLIAYVRPHAERLLSTWAERTKQGFITGPMETLHKQFLRKGGLAYARRFGRWRDVFGEALTLRPMIRERLKNGDVVEDFLDFALCGAEVELLPRPPSNASLTLQDLAVLREFQRAARQRGVDPQACQAFGWHFGRLLAGNPAADGTRPRLHRRLAERVVEAHEADARALDEAFFEGTPMTDALLAAPERAVAVPQEISAEALMSPAELRLLRLWIDVTLTQIEGDAGGFARILRERDLQELGLPPEPPLPIPMPPRLSRPVRLLKRIRRGIERITTRVRA